MSDPANWRERQIALGIPLESDRLETHEIEFLERFVALGNQFSWIPRDALRRPTNDFIWLNKDGIEVEMKRPRPNTNDHDAEHVFVRVVRMIRADIRRAHRHDQQIVKQYFVVDLDDRPVPPGLMRMLAEYNLRAQRRDFHSPQITRLWLMSEYRLLEINQSK